MLFFIALGFTFSSRHPQLSTIFPLAQLLLSFCSDQPLPSALSQQHIGHLKIWGLTSSVISFCLSILFMGFSWQKYWSVLPFPPPVDPVLSEFFTKTHPSWLVIQGMAHSFIELCKPLCHAMTRLLSMKVYWSQQKPHSSHPRDCSIHGHHQIVNAKVRLILFFLQLEMEKLCTVSKNKTWN